MTARPAPVGAGSGLPPPWRLPLLMLGFLGLIVGAGAGLARLGWNVPALAGSASAAGATGAAGVVVGCAEDGGAAAGPGLAPPVAVAVAGARAESAAGACASRGPRSNCRASRPASPSTATLATADISQRRSLAAAAGRVGACGAA